MNSMIWFELTKAVRSDTHCLYVTGHQNPNHSSQTYFSNRSSNLLHQGNRNTDKIYSFDYLYYNCILSSNLCKVLNDP